ncbi:tripartite tricarboxylate transporter substrate binding protein [Sphaerotilus sp.]|uniref:Bug family tripartite tricarboxylate transporter substrate binding protein n=1 Tax=Sphaerotilus sp. TaxID=2093942 RepID=UPI002ACECA4F|nr:tripartite tricarboxylate transporter substrate binding protein [Sphaerotilus sp.]MDZ7858788.1 tripartite tricarboxylate transporter substrate binding protein [Sphaerotilus sp.]
MTTRRQALTSLVSVAAAALPVLPLAARADTFPSKPITLLVPFAPGGIADITARTVAQAMGPLLGQTVVVENKPSAGSIVASQAVAKAAPDGHTLLLMSNGNAVSASLFKKLPFDVTKDFAFITTLGFFEMVVAVDAGSRFKSLGEVLAYARANPGKLNIGTIAVGSTQNLAAELLKMRAGLDAVIVPYKGSPDVLRALKAGDVDVAVEILGPTMGQITGGTIRALALTDDRRNPVLPDVPTVQEAGVKDYDVTSWNALAAPAGTPADVVAKIGKAARDALATPAVTKRLQELGVRAQSGTPAQLDTLLQSEIRRWRDVIQAAKIEPQ